MIRSTIQQMAGYTPGEQLNDADIVKLNTNENPYPPSPRVFEAVKAALTGDKLRKYPSPTGDAFRKAAGKVLGVDPDAILIGNGSDDILTILTRAYVPEGGLIASPTPSYVLYRSLAQIQGARFETVPFTEDWKLPNPWPVKGAHLTFLPNPNSPSGTALRLGEVERFAAELGGPLVLDEAYGDFCEWNGLSGNAERGTRHAESKAGASFRIPSSEFRNVIVTRSFSKYYALAGVRFGFAVAEPATIRELNKVKDSYNCDVLSLTAATAAIEDQPYYSALRSQILATRGHMSAALSALGFHVTPSDANFVWCRRTDRPVQPIYEELKRRKILVRYMNYAGYGDGLRISVGTNAEIEKLLKELKAIV